jgi:hypothetical protein
MILFFLRGEKESRASSSRRNQGRINRERKKHGHRTDFLFKFNQGELGCAEVGKMRWSLSYNIKLAKGFRFLISEASVRNGRYALKFLKK